MPVVPHLHVVAVLLSMAGTAVAAAPVAPCTPIPPAGRAVSEGFRFTPRMLAADRLIEP